MTKEMHELHFSTTTRTCQCQCEHDDVLSVRRILRRRSTGHGRTVPIPMTGWTATVLFPSSFPSCYICGGVARVQQALWLSICCCGDAQTSPEVLCDCTRSHAGVREEVLVFKSERTGELALGHTRNYAYELRCRRVERNRRTSRRSIVQPSCGARVTSLLCLASGRMYRFGRRQSAGQADATNLDCIVGRRAVWAPWLSDMARGGRPKARNLHRDRPTDQSWRDGVQAAKSEANSGECRRYDLH